MTQRSISVSRVIDAPASTIFAMLSTPSGQARIDGSGTVKAASADGDTPLELGSRFGMRMRMGVPYRVTNLVVEFEQDRRIAWRHFGRHVWRYELEPVEDGTGTRVTETFDWSHAVFPKGIELMGYPTRHPAAMAATLERLDELVTAKA
jgi:uncharacterized protein YndB with AHSA1/START domain